MFVCSLMTFLFRFLMRSSFFPLSSLDYLVVYFSTQPHMYSALAGEFRHNRLMMIDNQSWVKSCPSIQWCICDRAQMMLPVIYSRSDDAQGIWNVSVLAIKKTFFCRINKPAVVLHTGGLGHVCALMKHRCSSQTSSWDWFCTDLRPAPNLFYPQQPTLSVYPRLGLTRWTQALDLQQSGPSSHQCLL